ncbi:MAG: ATP-binding protein [Symploca sp. SIO2G7]|nr:ATP-binding protein [Symploca sp. SIO2G7]
MDSTAAFIFINSVFLQKTNKGLSECEQDVIYGIWEGKTYEQISEDNNRDFQYVKETGPKLFKKIENILGIKVNKSTFKPTIQQLWQEQQSAEQPSLLSVEQASCLSISHDKLITNPFLPLTGIVDDPELFFDRQPETREIFALFNSGSSVALIGERSIGKSSLLKAICREATTQLHSSRQPIYLDLQPLENEDEFYTALCEEAGIPQCRGYSLTRELRKHRLLLAIDEVEKMTWDGFTREVRAQLRGLAEGINAPLRLILAARDPLDSLFQDSHNLGMTSPLSGICHQVDLGGWNEATIRDFIASRLKFPRLKPLAEPVRFTEEEILHIIATSGGHPQKLMKLCYQNYHKQHSIIDNNGKL